MTIYIGASQTISYWSNIDWVKAEEIVYRLQMRIAKAVREKRYGKVKTLQWLLTRSLYAKLLAVKRVTSSTGARTAGIDGKLYKSNAEKLQLALSLKQRGYKTHPLKRVYIPKANGKKRALGIPTLHDRAMQALYLLAIEPVSEMLADQNSYGFRPKRSTADAVEQAFKVLCHKDSAEWILEADIKACFDTISHEWLMNNVTLEKKMLKQWLEAGYFDKQTLFPTAEGTPQGGIISPILANLALDGLEQELKSIKLSRPKKIHLIRYADDFVVTAASKEVLENEVKPVVERFLKERGLYLSTEKTSIIHIDRGFDFLGFNIRKYKGKLLIKPSRDSIKRFLKKIRSLIKSRKTVEAWRLIGELNPKITGWGNYYKHVISSKVFGYIDDCIYRCVARWTKRRHNNKNKHWIAKKYFCRKGLSNWVFFGTYSNKKGGKVEKTLKKMGSFSIERHIKIKKEARLYDPEFSNYFAKRKQRRDEKLYHNHLTSNLSLFGMDVYNPKTTSRS